MRAPPAAPLPCGVLFGAASRAECHRAGRLEADLGPMEAAGRPPRRD
ncbi:hypothetical protein [Glycomyces tenuis]|nr:hypothetical protein [Glycomyces tenuis]